MNQIIGLKKIDIMGIKAFMSEYNEVLVGLSFFLSIFFKINTLIEEKMTR